MIKDIKDKKIVEELSINYVREVLIMQIRFFIERLGVQLNSSSLIV